MKLLHAKDKLSNSKNVRHFQCTYKSCGAIITWLGQHLTCTHHITNAKLLAQVKAACIRLPTNSMPSVAPAKAKTKAARPTTPKSTSSKDESFVSGENTTDKHVQNDEHQLQIEADLDDISSYAALTQMMTMCLPPPTTPGTTFTHPSQQTRMSPSISCLASIGTCCMWKVVQTTPDRFTTFSAPSTPLDQTWPASRTEWA